MVRINKVCIRFVHRALLHHLAVAAILVALIPAPIQAQNFWVKHYTTEDGLPSNEVYDLLQDRHGFLWFATDNGLSQYDGYEFRNYHVKDGLVDAIIFELTEDYRGRIWYGGNNSRLGYYDRGSWYTYRFNDSLAADPGCVSYFSQLYVDTADRVHIGFHVTGYVAIDDQGARERPYFEEGPVYQFLDDSVGFYSFEYSTPPIIRGLEAPMQDLVAYVRNKDSTTLRVELPDLIKDLQTGVCYVDSGLFLYSFKSLYYIQQDSVGLVRTFSDRITWVHADQKGRVWVGLKDKGLHIFHPFQWDEPVYVFPDLPSASGVLEDREGGYWISSATHGVYYLQETPFNTLKITEDQEFRYMPAIFSVTVDRDGIVYAGGENQTLYIWDRKKRGVKPVTQVSIDDFKSIRNYHPPIGFLKYNPYTHRIWGATYQENFVLDPESHEVSRLLGNRQAYNLGRVHSAYFEPNSKRAVTVGRQNIISFEDTTSIRSLIGVFSVSQLQAYAACPVHPDTLLVGMDKGIRVLGPDKKLQSWHRFPQPRTRVTDIHLQGHDTLVLASRGEGLFVYFPDRVVQITTEDGLASNNVTNVSIDAHRILWIATWEGLNYMKINREGSVQVGRLDARDGIPPGKINRVLCNSADVFLATDQGLLLADRSSLIRKHASPVTYIRSAYVQDSLIAEPEELFLAPEERNIEFEYVALSYMSMGNLRYRYQLDGADNGWRYTNNRSVTYSQLPAGNYTFRVAANISRGEWGPESTIRVSIQKYFWETWWFRLVVSFLIAISVVSLFRYLLDRSKRAGQVKAQIKELKLQALRAQMNPHFIFNVLSAIQTFIGKNDTLQAQEFLASFATLIRMSLDHSIQTWVPLSAEMHLLKKYLDLEQMRFNVALAYTIQVDHSLDTDDVLIPTMLIQPFVENALIHGLANKESDCRLIIDLRKQGESLICTVTDNGIGREAASRSSSARQLHKSVGVTVTAKRLELIRGASDSLTGIHYIDLKDSTGRATGTEVAIHLPYKLSSPENTPA